MLIGLPILGYLKCLKELVLLRTVHYCGCKLGNRHQPFPRLQVWNAVDNQARKAHTSIIHGKYSHEETIATASFATTYLIVRDLDEAKYVANYIKNSGSRQEFLEKYALLLVMPLPCLPQLSGSQEYESRGLCWGKDCGKTKGFWSCKMLLHRNLFHFTSCEGHVVTMSERLVHSAVSSTAPPKGF